MKKQLSLKNSFNLAWNRLNTKEKLFVIIAFLASLSFTLYGMLPTLVTGDFTALNTLSIIMSIFGFIGTWTLALQWQHTFKANGIQNIAGILVAGMQGIYGDMFTSFYYLVTEFIGHYSWKKRRNDNGELVVDKKIRSQRRLSRYLLLDNWTWLSVLLDGWTKNCPRCFDKRTIIHRPTTTSKRSP